MKTLKKTSAILIFITILISCSSKRTDLFNVISVQIPAAFNRDGSKENLFVDNQNGDSLIFSITKNKSFDELLSKIVFDSLFLERNSEDSSELIMRHGSEFTVNERGREVSGLKVALVEGKINNKKIKMFITEVNNEILMGEIKGDIKNAEYLDKTLDMIINSIKKKY